MWRKDAPPLYPYQQDGLDWMRRRSAFLLADEPGLGKSPQVLADFANLRLYRPNGQLLITAPNNVIYKWAEREVPKWTTFSVEIATGTAKQRKAAIQSGADAVVIAYDNLSRELSALNEVGFVYLAFDEAHNIKNRKAQRTKAGLSLRGMRRALITGSPFLNRVDELWPLLFMAAPTEFGDYWQFVNRYAVFGGYEGRQIVGAQNVRELRARMHPFMLRRTLADVGTQIPDLTVIPVEFDLSPKQRAAYDQAYSELKIVDEDGELLHEFENPMTRFMRLRQITNTLASVGGRDESAKLDRAMELIAQIGRNHKVVVFSGDLTALACMRRRLAHEGILAPVIAGKDEKGKRTGATDRQPVIDAFQNESEPRILLASHGVAREGIDLFAAHHCIVLDKQWNPELQKQEYGRLRRTGQQHPVIAYELFARNTVDSRVEKLLAGKAATFDAVIEDDPVEQMLLRAVNGEYADVA